MPRERNSSGGATGLVGGERDAFAHFYRSSAMVIRREQFPSGWPCLPKQCLKIPVAVRHLQIRNRETDRHYEKVKDAQLGGACATPGGGARQLEIK